MALTLKRLTDLRSEQDEEEEKKKKLSGLDRLNAARGKTEEPAKKEEPAAPQQQLSGMERLNAAREKQKTEPQTAAPQISNTYREVDKEKGRIRTRSADLSTPSWQDDPDEMAAELNMLGATLEDTGSKLTALSSPRNMANAAVQNIGSQIKAYETKLGMLADTAANSTDAGERLRAQQESKALDLYYQKAKLAQERYTARANELNSQFDTLAGAYESALQKYQTVEPKYTRRLGLGDSKATRYQQEADKLIRQADTLSRGAATAESNAQTYGVGTESAGKIQNDRDTADRLTAQARDLLNKADREREYYSTYQYMQYMDQLNQFRQDPEFEAKSQADPALMQLEWSGPYGLKLNPEYKDIDYAIINGSQDAYRASIDPETFNANDKAYLQNLTAEERAYYNYVYKTQGKAKADEFIKQITPQLTTKQREKDKTWWQDYARNKWGAASAFSVLEKPMAIQTLAMQIADYADDGKIDTNAAYNKFATIPTDIRAVAAEKYDEKGAAVYQQVMSMADNVYNRLITGGFGMSSEATTGMLKFLKGMTSPTIMLMMGEAAADSIIANKNLGMDDDRAMILGIGAGLIEGLTENVSMEQLLNPGQLADGFLTTLAKMFTAEASEEGAADLLNWAVGSIYDAISGMDESEYRQHIRQYVQQGMSTEEAARKAMQERYEELALDMLGGGISGGLFGGSNYVFNSTMYNAAMSATGKSINTGNIQGMIDLGLQSPDGSVAKNTALEIQDRIAKGQRVSNAQVGRLALSVIKETVDANTDAAAAEAQPAQASQTTEVQAPAEAAAPKTVLQQMADKLDAGQQLSGQDARKILADPDAKQTLIDAGLITGREINDSAGRTKVAQAAEQYIRQQTEEQNAPQVPQAAQTEQQATPPVPQAAAQAETESTPPVPGSIQTENARETVRTTENNAQNGQQNAQNPQKTLTGMDRLNAAREKESKTVQRTLATARQKAADKAESLQNYGFTTAGAEATARVQNEQSWDAEEKAVAQALRDAGYEPTFTVGLIENAEGDSVPYLVEGNKIAIRADGRQSIQTLAEQAIGRGLNIDQSAITQAMADINKARESAKVETPKAETPKVSARYQAAVDSAKAAGASEEAGALAGRLAEALGRDIVFYNEDGPNGNLVNGYTADGKIYINAGADRRTVAWVVGHELTHNVENSKVYNALKNLAKQAAKAEGQNWNDRVQQRVDSSARVAEKLQNPSVKVDTDGAERELVADFFADRLLTNEDAIRAVCEYETSAAKRIRNYIQNLLRKLGGKEPTLEWALDRYNKALKDVAAKAHAEAQSRLKLKSAPEAKAQGSGLKIGGNTQNSVDVDEDYMAAVEAGDMATAQRMVDEAAERAMPESKVRDENGKLKQMYHGTSAYGFTVFDYGKRKFGLFGTGFYFTDNPNVAQGYTRKGRGTSQGIYDVYLNITNPLDMDAKADMTAWRKAFNDADYDESYLEGNETNEECFLALKEYCQDEGMYKHEAEDAIEGIISYMGHDGITHIGGGRYSSNDDTRHRVYIAFEQEQIKSAEPVTRDNQGNVIAPSERFNEGKADIRWSVDSDDEYRETAGTPALEKLGIRLAGSKGKYHLAEQLLERDKAAKALMRATKKAEKKLNATKAEKEFAAGIAAGIYEERDIPKSMNKDKVTALADYYAAEDSFKTNMLADVRDRINGELKQEAEDLLLHGDFNFKKLSMLQMNERTPDRTFRAMFGTQKGKEIFDWLIRPVQMNESEKTRWHQKQLDRVRKFKDAKGKTRALTRDESALTMLVMEGKAAAAAVADMEKKGLDAKGIRNAAENIRNGQDAGDAAQEFGLKDKERELAKNYATWMDTQEKLKNADSTIIEAAAEKYSKIFDEMYDAINDFLVAHGYEPIGYIKGYAPHMQPEETQNLLEKAFDKMGIDLGNDKAQGLPASIAGETAYFKPNKRWDPYFLHRTGTQAQYDIEKAYQSYVGYLSDILYHTDDIMRVRNFEKMLRKTYAPDEIREDLDMIQVIRDARPEDRQGMLRNQGKIGKTTQLSAQEVSEKLDEWEESLYNALKEDRNYNNLVMWLSNYANILAGKQSFADRGWEYSLGRNSLNFANRLQAAFQRSLVAGSLSSAINQTAQLPMIKTELGDRWYYKALTDILTGKTKGFRNDSDFLTTKHGVDMLTTDNYDKFINAIFTPSNLVDNLVSTVAVRGAYLKNVNKGMSYSEAMRAADDFGRKVMGSREKGTRPLAYESKGLFSRMVHMFQVEAANSWDHIASDLPYEIRQIAKTQGKTKAATTLAALLLRGLLSAFLLNRATEEIYGGTPAPFDVIGLAMNFVASGQGMTTNAYLKKIIDNGLEKIGQDRFFGTEDVPVEFNTVNAVEETLYNVMNDVPFARNVAGVLGLGDQSVPLPGAGGEFTDVGTAVKDLIGEGADAQTIENLIRASVKLGAQFAPAGRQITKTAEGIEAAIKGGSYSKKGKLQYSIDTPADKARAVLFGKNATQAAREHWASGEKTLSENQTALVSTMRGWGMSGAEARKVINDISSFEAETDPDTGKTINGSKKAKVVEYIDGLKQLTSKQKDQLYLAQGYAESGLDETPWHSGGGSGKGKTYAKSGLRIPTPERREPTGSGLRLQSAPAAKPTTGGLKLR